MRQIVIAKKGVAYAAKNPTIGTGTIASVNEIDQLAPGALAVFTDNNLLVTAATTAAQLASSRSFYIAQGVDHTSSDVAVRQYSRRTVEISRESFNKVYKEFKATKNHTMMLGHTPTDSASDLFLPSLLVPDSVSTVVINFANRMEHDSPLDGEYESNHPAMNTIRVESHVLPTDTPTTYLQRLVDKLNAHPENVYDTNPSRTLFTASLVDTSGKLGIQVTCNLQWQVFTLASDDILSHATKTITQNVDYGHGDWRQISEIEQEFMIEDGDSNRIHLAGKYFKAQQQVARGEEYDTFEFEWHVGHRNSVYTNSATNQMAIIATPTGDAIKAILTTIFTNLVGTLSS